MSGGCRSSVVSIAFLFLVFKKFSGKIARRTRCWLTLNLNLIRGLDNNEQKKVMQRQVYFYLCALAIFPRSTAVHAIADTCNVSFVWGGII